MNKWEASRAVTVCGLRAGRTMKDIMSYGNINKSTDYDFGRKFEHFQDKYENIMSRDELRYPEITITSSSRKAPLPRQQEDAGLAQGEPYGGGGGGGLAS